MRFDDIRPPDTAAAMAALEVATEYSTPALLAHSIRSWYWALGFAAADGVEIADPEALYVAAVLHDLGLAEPFDAVRMPYEFAAGHAARVLLTGAGWTRERRIRVAEIIERHNWPSVDRDEDPDGYLLEVATGLDISGARPDALDAPYVGAVLAAHPRTTLAEEFGACVLDQAARKPSSQARRLVDGGVVAKLAANPLEHLH